GPSHPTKTWPRSLASELLLCGCTCKKVGKIFLCIRLPVLRGSASWIRSAGSRVVVSTSDRGHVFVGWLGPCRVALGFAAPSSPGAIRSSPYLGEKTVSWSARQCRCGVSKQRENIDSCAHRRRDARPIAKRASRFGFAGEGRLFRRGALR